LWRKVYHHSVSRPRSSGGSGGGALRVLATLSLQEYLDLRFLFPFPFLDFFTGGIFLPPPPHPFFLRLQSALVSSRPRFIVPLLRDYLAAS
jgi:hypothetical protein